MKAIKFEGHNVVIAEHQPKYQPLPAFINEFEGSVTVAFQLDEQEVQRVLETGVIYLKFLTFGQPLQPIAPSVLREEVLNVPDPVPVIWARSNVDGMSKMVAEIVSSKAQKSVIVREKDIIEKIIFAVGDILIIPNATGALGLQSFIEKYKTRCKIIVTTPNPERVIPLCGTPNILELPENKNTDVRQN